MEGVVPVTVIVLLYAGEIVSMSWSADSELLAVLLRTGGRQLLQLWHRSNWHWYLKREEHFPPHTVRVGAAPARNCWIPGAPCTWISVWDSERWRQRAVEVGP